MFSNIKESNFSLNKININENQIVKFINKIKYEDLIIPKWQEEVFIIEEKTIDYEFIILINLINFSYWQDENINKWKVNYKGNFYSGAMGLFAALKKAYENNYPIFDKQFLKDLSLKELKEILFAENEIPMLKERLKILNQVGRNLINHNIKNFYDLIEKNKDSAIKFIKNIISIIPSLRDTSIYQNQNINFLKRAQLICAMLYGRNKNRFKFKDINQLTIFADYRVPQTLRKLGILCFNQELENKIEKKETFQSNSINEIEIRLSTVLAGKNIINEYNKLNNQKIHALNLDYYLWKKGKEIKNSKLDFHRCRNIFY